MDIVVTGAGGMLGTAVCEAAERMGHRVVPTPAPLDIMDVSPAMLKGDVLINCAGLVKGRPENEAMYMMVNAVGPRRLAAICDQLGMRMIQMSTDCVFDGSAGPHKESDPPTAKDIYSVSKVAGEIDRPPHVTVRTSFVGRGPRGLVKRLLDGQRVPCPQDALWTGNVVRFTAEALILLAERSNVSGILHMPGCEMTRLSLVKSIIDHLRLDVYPGHETGGQDRRLSFGKWLALDLPITPSWRWQLRYL